MQPVLNRILDDSARVELAHDINELRTLCPDMSARKPERSHVQQAWIYRMVKAFARLDQPLLCVGCFEDTAHEALQKIGYTSVGIDPVVNQSLAQYKTSGPLPFGLVFSTSVIEHVPDDEQFLRDAASLVAPGGFLALTCDFKPDWQPGQSAPTTSLRFYTPARLREIAILLAKEGLCLYGRSDWNSGAMDFTWEGYWYAFATLIAQRT
jgi:SAM-dependent methyltransferase